MVEVPASSAVPPAGLRKARSEVACARSAATHSVLQHRFVGHEITIRL
jgi:hypothetical protein